MNKYFPVSLFVFKRPSTTKVIFDLIANSGISKVYVFADGPRDSREKTETDKVKKVINSFISSNPSITVVAKYSHTNQGLQRSFTTGLNKLFQKEEAVIILEDDCLPSPDFFKFVTAMLTKYADNDRIMSVAGTSVGSFGTNSYDFSRYQLCWGWATWRRAWLLYDPVMKELGSPRWRAVINRVTRYLHVRKYWWMMLNLVRSGWLKTWDYQWTYTLFMHNGLAVIPGSNLVSNIGFDDVATNTKAKSNLSNMERQVLTWPLTHPKLIKDNEQLSHTIEAKFYNNPVAILGMLRQYIYWTWSKYAHRH